MNEMRKELVVLRELGVKPNYAELARKYQLDYRTIKKYNLGYEGKSTIRNKPSVLDKYKDAIKEKINLPGVTVKSTYKYFYEKDSKIGTYKNFNEYVKKRGLKIKEIKNVPHPRYETPLGKQLQFDWKEDIRMVSKYGELFEFNIFSATLGASRFHTFIYSKLKTQEDVQRCLVEVFKHIQGLPEEILTDNMSSIVNTSKHSFNPKFAQFCKDIGVTPKKCKVRSPQTKGKVESSNRFMNWLIPYNHEFEDENDLIRILKKINQEINNEVNPTTGITPIMFYQKEKEYLKPLPNKEILNSYIVDTIYAMVSNEFLVMYKGNKYSVSPKLINKQVKLKELNNKLYVYYNNEIIAIHEISNKKINYLEGHYQEGLMYHLKCTNFEDVEKMAQENLMLINNLTN